MNVTSYFYRWLFSPNQSPWAGLERLTLAPWQYW
jgi:hypothetical protein